jgi:hypothetical protein
MQAAQQGKDAFGRDIAAMQAAQQGKDAFGRDVAAMQAAGNNRAASTGKDTFWKNWDSMNPEQQRAAMQAAAQGNDRFNRSAGPAPVQESISKFLCIVKEAELNQPDPKYVEYAQLMAKYDMLAKEMAPDASGLGVEKGASPDAIASIDAIKTKAEQLAGPNLQAWEQARQKENTASMAQANANLPAMAAQLENAPAAQQSPEQIAYNQLRAQLDSADAIRGDAGANTFTDVSPEVTAKTTAMRTKLAQMAAALKAKGIDAEAEYDAPDPSAPVAAPVDLAKKYVDENTGMSRLLSIISEGRGPLNRSTTAEAITMQHYTPVQNVIENSSPSMISKYVSAVEQELKESANRTNARATELSKRIIAGMNEDKDPCWDNYKMVGTKKKGSKSVPNCVPKEAVNPAQQAAIAIAKKKAGKK